MKKALVVVLVFCSLLSLCSCFPDGSFGNSDENKLTSAQNTGEVASQLGFESVDRIDEKLDDNLEIHADVTGNNETSLSEISVSLRIFDADKVEEYFLSEKIINSVNEMNSENFPGYKTTIIECADESLIYMDAGEVNFYDDFYWEREYNYLTRGNFSFIRPDLKEKYNKEFLDGIDKNDAVRKVEEALSFLDVSVSGEAEVISLDYETMDSEWTPFEDKHGNEGRKWEREDEAYLIIYNLDYNGVAISENTYTDNNNQSVVGGSQVIALVSRSGLNYLSCKGVYDVKDVKQDDIIPIKLDVAIEQIRNKYRNIILTAPITVTDITLKYMPKIVDIGSINFSLEPAWIFTAKQAYTVNDGVKEEYTGEIFIHIYISAETGQELFAQ